MRIIGILRHSNWNSERVLAFVLLAVFCLLGVGGPSFFPDSDTYINGSPHRSPIYPLFLALTKTIAGGYFAYVAVVLQLLLGWAAILVLALFLRRALGFSTVLFALVVAVLSAPYFTPGYGIGNGIFSEGLAYPLFLLACRYLLDAMMNYRGRSIFIALVWVVLLILTRKQFLFLWPVLFLVIAALYYKLHKGRQSILFLAALIAAIIITSLVEREYNYLRHGFFGAIPFTGMQLVVAPLFLAKAEDIQMMPTQPHAEFFRSAHGELIRQELLAGANKSFAGAFGLYDSYFNSYISIVNVANHEAAIYFGRYGISSEERLVLADQGMVETAKALIFADIKRYAKLYMLNVISGLGGNFRIGLSFVLLQMVVLGITFLMFLRNSTHLAVAILVALILNLANVTAVALVEPAMARYTFYTASLLSALLLVALYQGLQVTGRSTIETR